MKLANPLAIARILDMLTPTTLAAISVDLTDEPAQKWDPQVQQFLAAVDNALHANCGEEEAEQHRKWVRENV